MTCISLTPAYGRDYDNQKQVKLSWLAGHDWLIQQIGHKYDGKPTNEGQMRYAHFLLVLRYDKRQKLLTATWNPKTQKWRFK